MTVTQLVMEQFPTGLFGNATFQSGVDKNVVESVRRNSRKPAN
jgi:hypothetical protein